MQGSNGTRIIQLVKVVGASVCRAVPRHGRHGARHIQTAAVMAEKADFSRFPVPSSSEWPADLQEKHKILMETAGFVPNVMRAWAYRPDELKAFLHYHDLVMQERGNLTTADKEMIIVATSAENKCLYCMINRGAMLRLHSRNPYIADQLIANWRTAEIDERQRAIIDFAITLCHADHVTDAQMDALEAHGMTRDDAWDIGAVTALFALSNRMAHLMNLKPNKEFYSMGRDQSEN